MNLILHVANCSFLGVPSALNPKSKSLSFCVLSVVMGLLLRCTLDAWRVSYLIPWQGLEFRVHDLFRPPCYNPKDKQHQRNPPVHFNCLFHLILHSSGYLRSFLRCRAHMHQPPLKLTLNHERYTLNLNSEAVLNATAAKA